MNQLEVLLEQAKKEAKKISQEGYSEGFRDAEGTADIMQRSFNKVQNLLLAALGRKRKPLEITEETATEVVEKLKTLQNEHADLKRRVEILSDALAARMQQENKNLAEDNEKLRQANIDYHDANQLLRKELTEIKEKVKNRWMWGWVYTPPAVFGGNTNTPKSLVFSEDITTPCTAEVEVLRQKIDRLKAYLLRHARENNKRAEELDKKVQDWTSFRPSQDCKSSYYLSGKGEAYANAHKKVMEILG